jgi:6-carboxyhexanoate--CoA ligase
VYSVRMRAAQGGKHEEGGRHISGAERIIPRGQVEETALLMLERAFSHTRGQADFINIIVEKVDSSVIQQVPLLPVDSAKALTVEEGHRAAEHALAAAGVTSRGAKQGILALRSLADSMRGAMLLSAVTGQRLDNTGSRGIRVSRMDIEEEEGFISQLVERGIYNLHVREALILASKVAAGPGMVAELCWSDDPEYTTGYVASAVGYTRIPHCKPLGSPIGGRIFFIHPAADLSRLENYLQQQPVLVRI